MTNESKHVILSYARGAFWLLTFYLLWCFGPAGYSSVRYRIAVYDTVEAAGVNRQSPDDLHQVLIWKADELSIPIQPDEVAVVRDPVAQTITASYGYTHPVSVFGHVFKLHMHGEHSAASYTR